MSSLQYSWEMLPQLIKDATRGMKVDLNKCPRREVDPVEMDFEAAGLSSLTSKDSEALAGGFAADLGLFAKPNLAKDETDPNPISAGPQSQGLWVPGAIKNAYLAGDYATITAAQKQNDTDLAPILHAIRDYNEDDENATPPWIEIVDESTGIPYQIIGSDNAWFWVRTLPPSPGESLLAADAPHSDQPTVEIGSYTSNSNFLGISVSIVNNAFISAPVGLVSLLVARSVGTVIKQRLTGVFLRNNLVQAIENNVAGGVARQRAMRLGYQIELKLWQRCVRGITTFLSETIIGFIVFWLLEKLIDVIYRYYGLSITIHNWDPIHAWKIVEWYSDQAKVGEGGEWKPYTLPSTGKTFKLPKGFAPTTGEVLAKHVVYSFENTVKVLAGLGVGFKIIADNDSTKGFMFKYVCPRGPDNKLGIRGFVGDGNLKDYYDDNSWADKGTTKLESKIDGLDVPIRISTNALKGEESHVYKVDVHIGG
ncbi:hypothetical protein BXZ70DRAFT_1018419 [Cristinia sonorae]|uniref:Uncharacterized protein n=1 Tax=Cristinia sonorae TaxID=1940300 RepID=A0A8K0US12_9AGAR|nr:hypothetical protein BXZ70DRAFT_1018419 [Cristinia sonorae]